MRLSTSRDRDEQRGIAVIRAALDAGITLLDTADSYCFDETDRGHNERLLARAIADWGGDRSSITVATKGGLRRHGGEWIPDGRAKSLREACDASRRALGQDTIDLYQLHVVDPKTPLATSIRALAKLKSDGAIRDVGLCNVTVGQIREAQTILPINSVQVSLGALDDENLRNGVAEFCRDSGIALVAYRPLGGDRRKALAKDAVLRTIAERHGATPEEVVLAWLLTFGEGLVPLPGATRVETIASIARARELHLGNEERNALDRQFSGRLLRVPRSERRPRASDGDVVVIMGMPGAGKSTLARELEGKGYERLNRDEMGGSLADLVPRLGQVLREGKRQVVLDNTYPTRASRNEVIEASWEIGAHVRCLWLQTTVADSQINSIRRMIEVHGSLPTPEEIRSRAKKDPRYLLPDAQFRYERTLEPPTTEEGFEAVDSPAINNQRSAIAQHRAVILDLDYLTGTPTLLESVVRHRDEGWRVFIHAWRPHVSRGEMATESVEQEFATAVQSLGGDVDWAFCPHGAGPPVCWCRKPLPGQVIEFATRRDVDLRRSIVVGASAAERTMAERIGAAFQAHLQTQG